MVLQKTTLKKRVVTAFIILSATTLLALLVSAWFYKDLVYKEETIGLTQLVKVKYTEVESNLTSMMNELGLGLQIEPGLRKAIRNNDLNAIRGHLNSEYHQYFVTAEMLSLQKIYLLNKKLQYVSESTEGLKRTSLTDPLCAEIAEIAGQRKGAARIKPISMLCRHDNRTLLSSIVPVGTLSPISYLQIVVDPVFNLKTVAESLGLEVRILSPEHATLFQSPKWPLDAQYNDFLISDLNINNRNDETVLTIEVAKPIAEFRNRFIQSTVVIFSFTGILITVVLIITIRVLSSGFRELHELEIGTQRVASGNYKKLLSSNYQEIDSVIQSFNAMTEKVENNQIALEQEVREATRGLNSAMQSLAEKNKDLRTAIALSDQANETKSAFLANMSHELRTPLNAIIGYSELLKEDFEYKNDNNTTNDLQKILSSAKHLLKIVNEILDLSKIEAGKVEIYKEPLNLVDVINDVVSTAGPMAEANNNVINTHFPEGELIIESDATRLKQILFNLVSNACKFTENGSITITTDVIEYDTNSKYMISLADTGIGLKDSELPDLFTAFTQADISTTKRYGGTGLGLALSKQLCELLGGSITVNSKYGEGSEFIVVLPRS